MKKPEDEAKITLECTRKLSRLPSAGQKRASAYLASLFSNPENVASEGEEPAASEPEEPEGEAMKAEAEEPAASDTEEEKPPVLPLNGQLVERRA